MARRCPTQITLVLIGTTAAVVGCQQPTTPMARDHYASLEDCAADWGRPERCERVQSSGHPGFLFFGPRYAPNARSGALDEARRSGVGLVDPALRDRAIGKSIAPSPTSRGGFGSSSRSYSAGT
jgi:uncharacterized protein YgiB involved in biofilm formation